MALIEGQPYFGCVHHYHHEHIHFLSYRLQEFV